MEIPLEEKVRMLYAMKNEGIGYYAAAKRCGLPKGSGYAIFSNSNKIKKIVFAYSRMFDGGLPYTLCGRN